MADDRMRPPAGAAEHGADDALNHQIVTLSNKLSLTVARRALAQDGLTLREWRIMLALFIYGPSIARRVSELALLDPAHVSRTVRQLEQRGLVAFRPNERDRRQIIIVLSAAGEKLARQVLPRAMAVGSAFREIYSDAEYATLIGLLSRANAFADRLLQSDETPPPEAGQG